MGLNFPQVQIIGVQATMQTGVLGLEVIAEPVLQPWSENGGQEAGIRHLALIHDVSAIIEQQFVIAGIRCGFDLLVQFAGNGSIANLTRDRFAGSPFYNNRRR